VSGFYEAVDSVGFDVECVQVYDHSDYHLGEL